MDTKIGKRCRELREAKLLTRQELAAKAGVAMTTIYNAEQDRSIGFRSIRAIAAALDVHPTELMQSEQATTRPPASRRKGASSAPLPQVA